VKCAADLRSVLPALQEKIVASAAADAVSLVKQVSDIPRMYRRTNRETPSKPCSYVTSLVQSLADFRSAHEQYSSAQSLSSWVHGIAAAVLTQYIVNVTDVLTNVTKMEESLKKLKKVRERGGAGGGAGQGKAGAGLSDDDKIRLQLYIDVMFFARELESWGACSDLVDLDQMKAVVTAAAGPFAAAAVGTPN